MGPNKNPKGLTMSTPTQTNSHQNSIHTTSLHGEDLYRGEMFDNTMRLVEECDLTYLHVFPFSPRKGTPAARMPQVNGREIRERAARLRAKARDAQAAYLNSLYGVRTEVLVEGRDKGRTPHFAEVRLPTGLDVGTLRSATLGRHDGHRIEGTLNA